MRSLVYGNSFLVLAALIILSARDFLGQKPPAWSLPTVQVTVTVRDETGAEIPEATVKFKAALKFEVANGALRINHLRSPIWGIHGDCGKNRIQDRRN